ncbi:MAG: phosphatase PAP2 family protein [Ferruginibacter sp.]
MRKALIFGTALIIFSSIRSTAQEVPVIDSVTTVKQAANQPVYKIKKGIDYPLTIATAAWGILGSQKIYGRDTIPSSEIMGLDRKTINNVDRWVSYNYSKAAAKVSDYFFVGSMPFPLILLFDKKIRKDGPKVGVLYLEAIGITSAVYVTSAMLADRHRPYSYNPDVDMGKRTRGGARNSFFAGHVAIVATSMFFTAQTYINYHPEMKNKWILYTGAGLITSTTGYLRLKAGQHFLTDVLTGAAIGTLSGLLTPYFHKIRHFENARLTILPNFQQSSSGGFTLLYNLDKHRNSK